MIPSVQKAAAVGAVVAVFAAGAGVIKTVFIDGDGGGNILAYTQKYDQLYRDSTRVVVRGNCYSSCTVVLGYPNTCLEPQAVLGFHPGYVPYLWLGGLAHYYISVDGTALMRRYYPADALEVIDRYKGLDNKGGWLRPAITLIKATEFPRRYQC